MEEDFEDDSFLDFNSDLCDIYEVTTQEELKESLEDERSAQDDIDDYNNSLNL